MKGEIGRIGKKEEAKEENSIKQKKRSNSVVRNNPPRFTPSPRFVRSGRRSQKLRRSVKSQRPLQMELNKNEAREEGGERKVGGVISKNRERIGREGERGRN